MEIHGKFMEFLEFSMSQVLEGHGGGREWGVPRNHSNIRGMEGGVNGGWGTPQSQRMLKKA